MEESLLLDRSRMELTRCKSLWLSLNWLIFLKDRKFASLASTKTVRVMYIWRYHNKIVISIVSSQIMNTNKIFTDNNLISLQLETMTSIVILEETMPLKQLLKGTKHLEVPKDQEPDYSPPTKLKKLNWIQYSVYLLILHFFLFFILS